MKVKQHVFFIFSSMLLLLLLVYTASGVQGFEGAGYSRLQGSALGINQTVPEGSQALNESDPSSNHYIVVMNPSVQVSQRALAIQQAVLASGGRVKTFYTAAINGFAAELPPEALQQLQADPDVAFIEPDSIVSISDNWAATNQDDAFGSQSDPVWGLDRIDQRDLPLDQTYTYGTIAENVHVYVVDTGIRTTHNEFTGRVGTGYSAFGDDVTDCNGHGTHVAGTIGGSTYGVAKGVTIYPVRVLDCDGKGTLSDVIAGLDWVIINGQSPGVVNMSLGGEANPIMDLAVNNVIEDGFSVVVAAGNDGKDACQDSPARVADAITVGATDSSDNKPSWSNYGTCLDLFAPGVSIKSAYKDTDTATAFESGTSMAAPHVAGAAAIYLQYNPSATPQSVAQFISDIATNEKVQNPGTDSPNRLLFVDSGPIPLLPTGIVLGGTPDFVWARVADATQYQLELYEGTSSVPVETGMFKSSVCGETNCSVNPEFTLKSSVGQYQWRARAYVGETWGNWSGALEFTYNDRFYTYLPLIIRE